MAIRTDTTRRALLGGIGLAAVAISSVAASAVTAAPTEATAPEPFHDLPLMPFALAWLAQWTAAGGSVMPVPYNPGICQFGWPEWSTTDEAKALEAQIADAPGDRQQRRRTFGDAAYIGKMRALADMLEAVPDGVATVKTVIANMPEAGWSKKMREAQA